LIQKQDFYSDEEALTKPTLIQKQDSYSDDGVPPSKSRLKRPPKRLDFFSDEAPLSKRPDSYSDDAPPPSKSRAKPPPARQGYYSGEEPPPARDTYSVGPPKKAALPDDSYSSDGPAPARAKKAAHDYCSD
jgi:hypothetical protein